MKRIITLTLLLCMVLGLFACGRQDEISYTPPTAPSSQPAPSTEPSTQPTEPTVPEVKYRHPLTGEPLDAPWTGRASGVALGNTKKAMPQHGLGQAALVYEAEVEGSSTRIMGVFADAQELLPIGPVRSARTFFSNIAESLDAVMFHAGGSVRGRNGYYDLKGKKIPDWQHVNALYGSNASTFYRDKDRREAGYNLEHTMFTDGERMYKALERKEYLTLPEGDIQGTLSFADDFPITGTAANTVEVKFKAGKTSTFTYDPETGLYAAYQHKQDWIDGNTGEVLTFKNLVVLKATQTQKSDGEYRRSYYTLVDVTDGEGWLVIDGQMTPIKWSRATLEDPFVYTLEDGTPVCFEPGHTYTAITSSKTPITCS